MVESQPSKEDRPSPSHDANSEQADGHIFRNNPTQLSQILTPMVLNKPLDNRKQQKIDGGDCRTTMLSLTVLSLARQAWNTLLTGLSLPTQLQMWAMLRTRHTFYSDEL